MTWDSFIKKPQITFEFHNERVPKAAQVQRSPIRRKWLRFFSDFQYTKANCEKLIEQMKETPELVAHFEHWDRVEYLIRQRNIGRSLADISLHWGFMSPSVATKLEADIIKQLKIFKVRV